MAKKSEEKAPRLGSAPTEWKPVDTTGIGGGGKPWDFNVFPECIGVLRKFRRQQVKGFDGGPARMKVLADVDVENVMTHEIESYTMFLPDGYERAFARAIGRWVKVERVGSGYDTRFDIAVGG